MARAPIHSPSPSGSFPLRIPRVRRRTDVRTHFLVRSKRSKSTPECLVLVLLRRLRLGLHSQILHRPLIPVFLGLQDLTLSRPESLPCGKIIARFLWLTPVGWNPHCEDIRPLFLDKLGPFSCPLVFIITALLIEYDAIPNLAHLPHRSQCLLYVSNLYLEANG